MNSIVCSGTPWERYNFYKTPNKLPKEIIASPTDEGKIWVKREDLCCPFPGPSFSKIRGLEQAIVQLRNRPMIPPTRFAGLDTCHSKAGWGIAYVCKHYNIPCTIYYPVYKGEIELRYFQKKCEELGAELVPMPATRSAILYHRCKKDFLEKYPQGHFLPNGLKLKQTVKETSDELIKYTPKELLSKNAVWVVSVSSGTIAAGVILGLTELEYKGTIILHMGYSRSRKGLRDYLMKITDGHMNPWQIMLMDDGYEYRDAVELRCPFPCNPYYDLKAWKWLKENIGTILFEKSPIVFWNIGS